jgi:hypothetical protein
VFVVGIELIVLPDGKEAAGVKSGSVPLLVLALVENFGTDIRSGVIGTYADGAFQFHTIAIAPGELVFLLVEIGTIATA